MFVSFEGGDGAGKSTQIDMTSTALRAMGHTVVCTREPGGTKTGKEIRNLLLHGDDMGPRTEALLFAADRAHHVETVIRPALDAGSIVLTDRYVDSSLAYQGAARLLGLEDVWNINMWGTQNLVPDKTILLDLDPVIGRSRLEEKKDRLEEAGSQFHAQVREQFLKLAENDPQRFVVIDAAAGPDVISAQILAVLSDEL